MAQLIYVTGVPGTGKSSVLAELLRRGHVALGTDEDHIAVYFYGDGRRVPPELVVDTAEWRRDHPWRMQPDVLGELAVGSDSTFVFICGSASNDLEVWSKFSRVFALIVDDDTLRARIDARVGNNFGKAPAELELVLAWSLGSAEFYRGGGATLVDGTRTVGEIIDEVLAATGAEPRGATSILGSARSGHDRP